MTFEAPMRRAIPPLARVLSRVTIDDESGCWLFNGALSTEGYGKISVLPRGSVAPAHRVVYEALVGEVPSGLVLDHLCRVRRCVNPAHLESVTNRENILRGEGEGARHARSDTCDHGHEYTPENTALRRGGSRDCLTCRRRRNSRSYRRARGLLPA